MFAVLKLMSNTKTKQILLACIVLVATFALHGTRAMAVYNGGSAQATNLLPISPAKGAGVAVLGVSTEAREAHYSAGAYQSVLATTSSTPNNSSFASLAETGAVTISAGVVSIVFLLFILYIYMDYRKHKAPLKEIDPMVDYTFMHHIKVVTLPIFRYRLQARIQKITRKPPRKFQQ